MILPLAFTHLQMEAALCIWEAMIDRRREDADGSTSLDRTWSAFGTVHMRHVSIALAPMACQVWAALSEDQRETLIPYDWEFMPRFVGCLDFEADFDHGSVTYSGSKTAADFVSLLTTNERN